MTLCCIVMYNKLKRAHHLFCLLAVFKTRKQIKIQAYIIMVLNRSPPGNYRTSYTRCRGAVVRASQHDVARRHRYDTDARRQNYAVASSAFYVAGLFLQRRHDIVQTQNLLEGWDFPINNNNNSNNNNNTSFYCARLTIIRRFMIFN